MPVNGPAQSQPGMGYIGYTIRGFLKYSSVLRPVQLHRNNPGLYNFYKLYFLKRFALRYLNNQTHFSPPVTEAVVYLCRYSLIN
jgi:hypothetical protein